MPYARPALCANVAGPVDIWITTGVSSNSPVYQFLGNSINGIHVADNAFMVPVHSDVNGGDHGPPIDYQYMGKQGYLQAELAQYNDTVLEAIAARFASVNGTATVAFTEGMLIGCAGAAFDIVLLGNNWVRHYLAAVPLEPIRRNYGSLHTRAVVSFVCNAIGGVIYDSSTTKYTGIPT